MINFGAGSSWENVDWVIFALVLFSLIIVESAHLLGTDRSSRVAAATTRFAVPLLLIFGLVVLRRLVAL